MRLRYISSFNIKAKDKITGNAVNDFTWRKTVNLLFQNMFQAQLVIGYLRFQANKQAFDNPGEIQPGFHVQIGKGMCGIVENAGIFFFQRVQHQLHHFARRKNLVGFLRRDIVKNIFGLIFGKIIGQRCPLGQKLLHRFIEYRCIKELVFVAQQAELRQGNARYFGKNGIIKRLVKIRQRRIRCAISHQE